VEIVGAVEVVTVLAVVVRVVLMVVATDDVALVVTVVTGELFVVRDMEVVEVVSVLKLSGNVELQED
jgi:hypothetical protein